jgi:integrase/recombinase XerD
MTDKAISPLRQRRIEDMTERHFAEKAQTDYIRYVKNFAAFLGRSPDTASSEDVFLFQQYMTKTHLSPGVINATVVALRLRANLRP